VDGPAGLHQGGAEERRRGVGAGAALACRQALRHLGREGAGEDLGVSDRTLFDCVLESLESLRGVIADYSPEPGS
jgi:hypothetical protein